ncbi:MAG: 4Fe-4S binding protein [Chitinophagales bacterium]
MSEFQFQPDFYNNKADISMSIVSDASQKLNLIQKISLAAVGVGLLLLLMAWAGAASGHSLLFLLSSTGLIAGGSLVFSYLQYKDRPEGIKNNGVMFGKMTARGITAWIAAVTITAFYVALYWWPQYLEGLIRMTDPLSQTLRGGAADQWFLYGFFYTLAVLLMGFKFILKYRHNRYQIIRTLSVMFFQLGFAFLIPAFMLMMNQPEFYFTYFWPLDSYKLRPDWISGLVDKGGIGLVLILISVTMTFIATPVLTYFFGKRWYCSWVCGCGGLAETAGDPYRHLSDKSLNAWKIERWMIHSVLVFVTLMTAVLWINSATQGSILGDFSYKFSKAYGFLIASMFSGVVGVGFYPIMGSRVWCRFGCPQAAILGIFQKFFSRFRITTNGGQCISCGNCSTYCEMGIDVRAYAQKGQNIVRASCVGCGVCAAVCPRGVLKLENGPTENRTQIHVRRDEVGFLDNSVF